MVEPMLKEKIFCEGDQEKCSATGCPLFGTPGRPARDDKRRIRGCADKVAMGRRSKRKGGKKQSAAARAVGIPRTNLAPGHEEHFGGQLRIEVKSGKQVGPIDTRYRLARAQSEIARPIGDNRPFGFLAMPDGMKDGYLIIRTDELEQVLLALADNFGMGLTS